MKKKELYIEYLLLSCGCRKKAFHCSTTNNWNWTTL